MSEKSLKDKIVFRYATKDDINRIALLELEIFSDPWTKEMIRADIEAKISRYIIADMIKDGALESEEPGSSKKILETVGYLGYWLVFDECSINNVGVVPGMQGAGLGSILMEKMLEETEALGARVWVLEVRAGNERAISLYKKYGFSSVGLRKKYYENGEDAIVMHRYRDK